MYNFIFGICALHFNGRWAAAMITAPISVDLPAGLGTKGPPPPDKDSSDKFRKMDQLRDDCHTISIVRGLSPTLLMSPEHQWTPIETIRHHWTPLVDTRDDQETGETLSQDF